MFRTIKSKFIITLFLSVFFPCLLITGYFYQQTKDNFTLRIQETLALTRDAYENTINGLITKGLNYGEFFTNDRSIREAVFYTETMGDHANLIELLEKYYASLDLNTIEFTSKDGIVLARGHLPDQFNDRKMDFPFTQSMLANQNKAWNYEIEHDKIILNFGVPMLLGKDFTGFLGYGYDINQDFLASIKQVVKAELLFILKDDEHIVATTHEDITIAQLNRDALKASFNGAETLELEKTIRDQVYSVLYLPVRDAEQQVFAAICVLKDITHTVNAHNKSLLVSGILVGCAVFFAVTLGVLITNSTTKPIKEAVTHLKTIAEGDLTHPIAIVAKGEMEELLLAMQRMALILGNVVAQVKEGADTVANGGRQMSSNAAHVSQGAAEQAAASEQASTSMEEMVANIRQNTDNAMQTEKIAIQTAENAEHSGRAVAEAVAAMREIARKVSIIEDITRQTRMLSLNATIESARAQEHGRGFAVVAAEVRSLAERSQAAAAEINQLASTSVTIAEQAGAMLKKLVPDIQRTAELVQEISAASREQYTGAEQINRALQQLDYVTQQNSATSEKLSITAGDVVEQAQHLQTTVAFFTVATKHHRNDFYESDHA